MELALESRSKGIVNQLCLFLAITISTLHTMHFLNLSVNVRFILYYQLTIGIVVIVSQCLRLIMIEYEKQFSKSNHPELLVQGNKSVNQTVALND